jgi:hypothetical protein
MSSYSDYYDFAEPPTDCDDCFAHENLLDEIKYWLTAVLDQIYGKEKFDEETLHFYLDELTHRLEMKNHSQSVAVTGKEKSTDFTENMLDTWKVFNNGYLQTLAKTGSEFYV